MFRWLDTQAGAAVIAAGAALVAVFLTQHYDARDRAAERRHAAELEGARRAEAVHETELRTVAGLVEELHRVPNLYVAYASHAVAVARSKASGEKSTSAEERAFYQNELDWAREEFWRAQRDYTDSHARLRGQITVARALLLAAGRITPDQWQSCQSSWEQPVMVDPPKLLAEARTEKRELLGAWMTRKMEEFNTSGRTALNGSFIACAQVLDAALEAMAKQTTAVQGNAR